MTLSCSCNDFDTTDASYWWRDNSGFHPIKSKNKKRCCSCKKQISHEEDAIEFYCYRNPKDDIEERIHGDEVQTASCYMCESCSGLYLALDELGYGCLDIKKPMKNYIAEYNEMREEFSA
jgi:hypothetical protein